MKRRPRNESIHRNNGMGRKLIIIGGVAAGSRGAARAKRVDPAADVTLLTREPHITYSACSFPYYIGRRVDRVERLILLTPEEFERSRGAHVLARHEAVAIDRAARTVFFARIDLLVADGALVTGPLQAAAQFGGVERLARAVLLDHLQRRLLDLLDRGDAALAGASSARPRNSGARANPADGGGALQRPRRQRAPTRPGITMARARALTPRDGSRTRARGRRSACPPRACPVPSAAWCGCRRSRRSPVPRAGGRASRGA